MDLNKILREWSKNIVYIPPRRLWQKNAQSTVKLQNYHQGLSTHQRASNHLSNVAAHIRDIFEDTDKTKSEAIMNYIKKLVPAIEDIKFDSDEYGMYMTFVYTGGYEVNANNVSDGILSLFPLILEVVNIDHHNKVILIDEPELSLHPQVQKYLCNLFLEISAQHQLIIATHSPHLVDWTVLENGGKIIRVHKDQEGNSRVFNWDLEDVVTKKILKSSKDYQKPHLLDTVAKELFFASKVVFVEGQEDIGCFKNEIKRRNISINFDFFGYGIGGGNALPNFLHLAKKLGIKSAGVLDCDMTSVADKCYKKFPDSLVRLLSTEDIRDKHCPETNKIIKKGIFQKDGSNSH